MLFGFFCGCRVFVIGLSQMTDLFLFLLYLKRHIVLIEVLSNYQNGKVGFNTRYTEMLISGFLYQIVKGTTRAFLVEIRRLLFSRKTTRSIYATDRRGDSRKNNGFIISWWTCMFFLCVLLYYTAVAVSGKVERL